MAFMRSTTQDAVRAAHEVGLPVAIKAISAAVTHRAAAGLVALGVEAPDAVARIDRALRARAAALGVTLDGTWVQRMVSGSVELLVTGFRDKEFGVMVGCGMGGGMTEIIDDAVLARAPVDADGAFDLLDRLRTLRRRPTSCRTASATWRPGSSRGSPRWSPPPRGRASPSRSIRSRSGPST